MIKKDPLDPNIITARRALLGVAGMITNIPD